MVPGGNSGPHGCRRSPSRLRLIGHLASESLRPGYAELFCCTDHIGYYEKSGFEFIGLGHHPWGEISRVYRKKLSPRCHSA